MTSDELARAWVDSHGLTSTPEALALASRRIYAWGRLGQTALSRLPSPVRVRVLEHGIDLVPHGCLLAEIWVQAADAEQVQRLASDIHRVIAEQVWPTGVMVVAAVHRARWWDKWLG